MKEFWESTFVKEKTNWGFESSDSAIKARDFFLNHKIRKILIPGAGYGRNAIPFIESKFMVTGIEIAQSAINLAKENHIDFPIYHGSVLDMPYDTNLYEGIFCYALIHLLNKPQRRKFLSLCHNQLKKDGYMIFSAVSKQTDMYLESRLISKDRYKLSNGLTVFFYDDESIQKEFKDFGLIHFEIIEEPVKHVKDVPPLKLYYLICKKQ